MKLTKHTMHIILRLDNNIIPEYKTLKHVGITLIMDLTLRKEL
jgi:hypothetical protein